MRNFDTLAYKESIENLKNIESLDYFLSFYDEDCWFVDPFHHVQGKVLIKRLFENMFKNLNNPQFINLKMLSNEAIIVVSWSFIVQRRGDKGIHSVQGSTWIEVNKKGLISYQRDYWDSFQLFQTFKFLKIPLEFIKTIFSKAQIK